jgi:hypothetical protein
MERLSPLFPDREFRGEPKGRGGDLLVTVPSPLAASRLCFRCLSGKGPERKSLQASKPRRRPEPRWSQPQRLSASARITPRPIRRKAGKQSRAEAPIRRGTQPRPSLRPSMTQFVSFVPFVVQAPQIPEPRITRSPRNLQPTTAPSGSESNRVLHFVFDSDADADTDTDACEKGCRPGSSSFLTVASLWGSKETGA